METVSISAPADLTGALCDALIELARREDDLAAAEAAGLPYWEPCPSSVYGRRAAADVLRSVAESLSQAA